MSQFVLGQLPENAKIAAIGDGAIGTTTMGNNKDNGEQRANMTRGHEHGFRVVGEVPI
jgi:hypothetical protein